MQTKHITHNQTLLMFEQGMEYIGNLLQYKMQQILVDDKI